MNAFSRFQILFPTFYDYRHVKMIFKTLLLAMMTTPGETVGACAYYKDEEARWAYIVEIEYRFTEEANR